MTRAHPTTGAVLVAAVAAAATVVSTGPAIAAPTQCAIVENELSCEYTVETPGGRAPTEPDARPSTHQPARSEPTAVWTREPFAIRQISGDSNVPGMDSCTTSDGQPGTRYRDTLLSSTGEVLTTAINCTGETQPAADPAPTVLPAPPPPPPSREELVASAPIPQPVIQRNPSAQGLTGLDSWFWASVGTTVEASVTLRGWTVTGTLGAGSLAWDTGDGGHYQTATPGTPDQPAVEHAYDQDGTWPVTVNMSWSGSYTIAGYGTSYTVDGLSAAGSASLDYEVIQIRSVLDEE